MLPNNEITVQMLESWLKDNRPVSLLDIRPLNQLADHPVPGSVHYNAYEALKSDGPNVFSGLYLDKAIPVVVFCEGGKSSAIAAAILQKTGYNALSLQGGLKAWRFSANTPEEVPVQHIHISSAEKNG